MAARDGSYEPLGYEKVTGLSTEKALTVPDRTRYVLLKTETQSVRWRDDGTSPTSTDGMLIDVGDEYWYTGKPQALEFIETTTSATLHASYYA